MRNFALLCLTVFFVRVLLFTFSLDLFRLLTTLLFLAKFCNNHCGVGCMRLTCLPLTVTDAIFVYYLRKKTERKTNIFPQISLCLSLHTLRKVVRLMCRWKCELFEFEFLFRVPFFNVSLDFGADEKWCHSEVFINLMMFSIAMLIEDVISVHCPHSVRKINFENQIYQYFASHLDNTEKEPKNIIFSRRSFVFELFFLLLVFASSAI